MISQLNSQTDLSINCFICYNLSAVEPGLSRLILGKNYPLLWRVSAVSSVNELDLCTAERHADHLMVVWPSIPKLKQDQITGTKGQTGRASTAVIENVGIKQLMKALEGNSEGRGSFYFREKLFFRPQCLVHGFGLSS
ncbi:MAG TPA: hypothetical protein VF493_18665 [Terriglobales bacterium]